MTAALTDTIREFEVGQNLGGYRVTRKEPLDHLQGTYYELAHDKTGARHIHIAVPDDNNTFSVLFPTVPEDSTGIAHILEHCVLTGSEKYPVRDPFFSMIPRSLKTFMNAMTSSDATFYPFSTRNRKDFFNLLSVYLDAVLFPHLSEETFKQEGHRFEFAELDDPSSGLRYKGVVFNEMKAQMATEPYTVFKALGRALYPDLTYSSNSGGDPQDMPNLTWEQLREFHSVHYHPTNGYFFTYGDLPMDEVLAAIEEQALSRFEKIDKKIEIADQPNFDSAKEVRASFPLAKGEDPAKKSQSSVAWKTAFVGNSYDVLVLRVLQEVLLGNAAAPLYKALMDSGLGSALSDITGFMSSFREAAFSVGLKGIDEQDAEKVEQIILDTLRTVADEGVDPERVDAAIHQLEIESREISNAGYPYSLKLFFEISGSYFHGGDPYRSLQFDEDVSRLQAERKNPGFFEDQIRRWFLDNTHRARIVVSPDQELEEQRNASELARLAEVEKKLNDDDKKAIVAEAIKLKDSQEADQDTSVLPTLELSDVPMEFEDLVQVVDEIEEAKVTFFPQPTNGLTYVDVAVDFSGLPDRLKDLLTMFSYAVPKMGAAGNDYLTMAKRIDSYTGGVGASATVRSLAEGGQEFTSWANLGGKALVRNHEEFISILHDLLSSVEFDPKRLKELFKEYRSRMEGSVVQNGHQYARNLAASKLGGVDVLDERLSGLTQLTLLKQLTTDLDQEIDRIIDSFKEIQEYLYRSPAIEICVTTEEANIPELRTLITNMLKDLPKAPAVPAANPPAEGKVKHEARTTAVPVNYNVKVVPTVPYTHPDAPALLVLSHLMRATYLHREIREKGGAYGAMAGAGNGSFSLLSYRDPNIVRTYQVYEDAVQEMIKGTIEQDDFKEAVLSACGQVDPLESPDTKGRRRFFDDRSGFTMAVRKKFKEGLLTVTEADLRRVAEKYLTDQGVLATIGSPENVAKANEEMGGIFEVSPV